MAGSQGWVRHLLGLYLRVYRSSRGWSGAIHGRSLVVLTPEFPDLATALQETNSLAKQRLAHLPNESDIIEDTTEWRPILHA